MKFIFLALITLGSYANAGTAKLTWRHDGRAIDGSLVPLTQFNVYWGVQGTALNNVIAMGPPAPTPWKIEAGVSTWSKTFDRTEWLAGLTVCFQMTAFTVNEESARSNTICKTFPQDPTAPIIIDIDRP